MATKDISRLSFDPGKHYSSVRMQQGRVMIDDDWNENERIENEDRRRARVEIVGPSGSPDQGFRIANPGPNDGLIEFDILVDYAWKSIRKRPTDYKKTGCSSRVIYTLPLKVNVMTWFTWKPGSSQSEL